MPCVAEEGLAFDDVLLLPDYSEVLPCDTSLHSNLTHDIQLTIPLLSAAMDTVTDARMAIAIAQMGGIGVIHKNMSLEQQAAAVRQVKKFESGVVRAPITISAAASLADLLALKQEHNISGVPVLENGKLVGIVTNRDVQYAPDHKAKVNALMTPQDKLVTVPDNTPSEQVKRLLHQHRIEKVLVVDDAMKLLGMITARDIDIAERYPSACRDQSGQLRSAAAIGVGAEQGIERAQALVDAGVDILVVDVAHGHSRNVVDCLRQVRRAHPEIALIAGNVATAAGAELLRDAGAQAVKVGMGPGSICTTRVVAGIGVPQFTAISNVAEALKGSEVKVIADGGVRYSGDIVKALAAGADVVMLGSLLAGTDEAPGEIEFYGGRSYKTYRGMGSLGAMAGNHGSSDRYAQQWLGDTQSPKLVPEGIEGRVPYRGAVSIVVEQLMGGVRSGMGYTGAHSIKILHERARFIRVTMASLSEAHVHDVTITREAPNYPQHSQN